MGCTKQPPSPGCIYAGEHLTACTHAYSALWGVPHLSKRNPCAQPVSLERRHIADISSNEYVVADKSDGVRYTLYLCNRNNQNFAFMVDRKLSFFQVPVAGCKRLFNGSIFDGELIWVLTPHGARSQMFLVFDVVALRGDASIQREDYHRRLEAIRSIFDLNGRLVSSPECATALAKEGKIICGGNAHGLSFRPKACFPLEQLDTLLRQIPTLPYATDGIVFTPVREAVCTGTAERMFKLKARHTIDLEVSNGQLWLGQGGTPDTATQRVALATVGITFKYAPLFAEQLEEEVCRAHRDGAPLIIECQLLLQTEPSAPDSSNQVELHLLGVRRDKVHPNTVRTALATVTNLRENIQARELCDAQRGSYRPELTGAVPPKPVGREVAAQGGAELVSLVVGDVIDAQRWRP